MNRGLFRLILFRFYMIIAMFYIILSDEVWQRAICLIIFTGFFYLDCYLFFKKKYAIKLDEGKRSASIIRREKRG